MVAKEVPWEEVGVLGDEGGRWIMVKAYCFKKLFTFVSLYAPNKGQGDFVEDLLERIEEFAEGTLVVGAGLECGVIPQKIPFKGLNYQKTKETATFASTDGPMEAIILQ